MTEAKQLVNNILYGVPYDPTKYIPIYINGELIGVYKIEEGETYNENM